MYFGSCGDEETMNMVFQLLKEYKRTSKHTKILFTKKRKDRIIFLGNKKNSGGGKNFRTCIFFDFFRELKKSYTHNFCVEIQKTKIQGFYPARIGQYWTTLDNIGQYLSNNI